MLLEDKIEAKAISKLNRALYIPMPQIKVELASLGSTYTDKDSLCYPSLF